ncbi:MAG TPA: S8 family serine peptidase [Chloroflexota bacterium]|nr:S8 family serine peptidase [Chloroflexota bacterium]
MKRRCGARALLGLLGCLVILLGALPPVALGAEKPGQGHVDAALRKRAAEQPGATLSVIVYRTSAGAGGDAVRRRGGRDERQLKTAHAVAAEVPADQIEALASEPGVARVAPDPPVKLLAKPEQVAGGLQTAYPYAVRAAELWQGPTPIRGTGVGVAVLDSGLDQHSDFLGSRTVGKTERPGPNRVVRRVAIRTDEQGGPGDDNGHGTFVAGVIAGRGWGERNSRADDGDYVGVAPDANLIGIKVSDRDGMSRTSDVIRGIEWAIENRSLYNIRVLNLSLQSAAPEPYTYSLLDAAVEMAWLKGIVVVVSAGNMGADSLRYAPANDPYVITVGATDDQGTRTVDDDRLAWFSSYGLTQSGHAKPELVAPGRRIVSTLSSTTDPLARAYPDRVLGGLYIRLSGTSAAAPVVTGVVAQLLQARPELTPDQVKWQLMQTAHPIPGPGTGAGYPQAAAAVRYAGPVERANRGLVPNRLVALAAQAALASQSNPSWDNISWDQVAWDNISWDNISWDEMAWENISWDTVAGD